MPINRSLPLVAFPLLIALVVVPPLPARATIIPLIQVPDPLVYLEDTPLIYWSFTLSNPNQYAIGLLWETANFVFAGNSDIHDEAYGLGVPYNQPLESRTVDNFYMFQPAQSITFTTSFATRDLMPALSDNDFGLWQGQFTDTQTANGLSPLLNTYTFNVKVTDTPVPLALPLFATGLGAIALLGWRRKRKAAAVAA